MSAILNFQILQQAIDQLRPELPALLGAHYQGFVTQLDKELKQGNVNRILDLFGRQTTAHQRLIELLPRRAGEITKGLFGDVNISLSKLAYLCPIGPHTIIATRIEQHDAAGEPLCPIHNVPMRRIELQQLRATIENLRQHLEELLGPHFAGFVAKLDIRIAVSDPGGLLELFEEEPSARQQLLKMLSDQ